MSEERKITAGTISGVTLKSIDIEPSIIVDGKSYTASEFNKAVEMLKQPQLNENQQIVLDELQNKYDSRVPALTIYELVKYPGFVGEAYNSLNPKEELQVLEVLIRWALEQEEE